MKLLTNKFFQVLERELSLREFESWLYSLDDASNLMKDSEWNPFFNFNYTSKAGVYEFSKLLKDFDLDEYAQFKFENSLKQILADGNLFRIVRTANDFYLRHDYSLFGEIGRYDDDIDNGDHSYENTRQQLAAIAEALLPQWQSLRSAEMRIAFLKGQLPATAAPQPTANSSYMKFYGKLWNFWKN